MELSGFLLFFPCVYVLQTDHTLKEYYTESIMFTVLGAVCFVIRNRFQLAPPVMTLLYKFRKPQSILNQMSAN